MTLEETDAGLVRVATEIKVLASASWPEEALEVFMAAWRANRPALPSTSWAPTLGKEILDELRALEASLDLGDPLAALLAACIDSYRQAAELILGLGTSAVTRISSALYGVPDERVPGTELSNIDAAWYFVRAANNFGAACNVTMQEGYSASEARDLLEQRTLEVLGEDAPVIVLVPTMPAKAAAGPSRVRLHDGVAYSRYELEQLLHHEVFTHSLTAINGRRQRRLRSLGVGSPRTTATQEGLATFSELVTGVIDLARLKRIALRILGTDMALKGADFIEVFRFFLDEGQDEDDAVKSTARIFRGVSPTGGDAFTKDTVYLRGLIGVHTFFRTAMRDNQIHRAESLFAGRMTLEDAPIIDQLIAEGELDEATYLPEWIRNVHTLAGHMAFGVFSNEIRLDKLPPR